MAGDWIKVEHAMPDKPEVVHMAEILEIDQDAMVGKLIRLWVWGDQQLRNGNAICVTSAFLDRITYVTGFAAAAEQVGWLVKTQAGFEIPNFDRHNGHTAKKRAESNRRVAKSREAKRNGNAKSVTNVTGPPLQKALPEKRREDYISPPTPREASAMEKQIAELLAYFNISTPVPMIGSEAMGKFLAQPQFLTDEGLAEIKTKAATWMAQDWIKDVSPKLIARNLAEIYNYNPKKNEKHSRSSNPGRDRNAGTANAGRASQYADIG